MAMHSASRTNRLLLVMSCQLRCRLSSASRGRSFQEDAAGGQPGSTAAQTKACAGREGCERAVFGSILRSKDAAALP